MPLFSQAQKFTERLKQSFADRLVSVVLFGSVARGDATPNSDIDLLVILKGLAPGRYQRRSVLEPLFEQEDWPEINCHLKTPDEASRITPFYYDFPADAKILHDSNDFFKKIIHQITLHMKKTKAVRKPFGKFYYWDLNPDARPGEVFEI